MSLLLCKSASWQRYYLSNFYNAPVRYNGITFKNNEAAFERRMARKEYLKEKGLPLVIPEDTKYIVLRYAYWKGDRDALTDYEFLEQNRTK